MTTSTRQLTHSRECHGITVNLSINIYVKCLFYFTCHLYILCINIIVVYMLSLCIVTTEHSFLRLSALADYA